MITVSDRERNANQASYEQSVRDMAIADLLRVLMGTDKAVGYTAIEYADEGAIIAREIFLAIERGSVRNVKIEY